MNATEIKNHSMIIKCFISFGTIFLMMSISVYMFGHSIINYQMHQVICSFKINFKIYFSTVNAWIVGYPFFMHLLLLCMKCMHEKRMVYYSSVYGKCIIVFSFSFWIGLPKILWSFTVIRHEVFSILSS